MYAHLVHCVTTTSPASIAWSEPLHACVFAEGTTVVTPTALWYAAQY